MGGKYTCKREADIVCTGGLSLKYKVLVVVSLLLGSSRATTFVVRKGRRRQKRLERSMSIILVLVAGRALLLASLLVLSPGKCRETNQNGDIWSLHVLIN